MYNLTNKNGQAQFKDLTSNNTTLSQILNNNEDLDMCAKKFIKCINQNIRKCFTKIRINDRPNKLIEDLFKKRQVLRGLNDDKSKADLKEVENKLADLCAQDNYIKIMDEISNIKCDEGGFNSGHLWKLKKKLSPRCRDPPTAMLDTKGNIITSATAIEALAVETYKKRLENRSMKDELKDMQNDKEELCKLRLKLASNNKTPDWTMEELETVLNYLKKNKIRDPLGFLDA